MLDDIGYFSIFATQKRTTLAMNITCIGHITRDKIVTPLQTAYMAGGTTTYVARGLQALLQDTIHDDKNPVDFRLIASLAECDFSIIEEMRKDGIHIDYVPSKQTSFFENIYGDNSNDRRQRVRSTGDPFTIEKLRPHIEQLRNENQKPYIILGSLLAEDFSLDVVKYCREFGRVVLDAQGYFRHVDFQIGTDGEPIGQVTECEWENKEEFFSNIDVLKLNENEARLITDQEDLHEAARLLHQQGIPEVLLTLGRLGSIIAAEGEVIDIPVVPELQTIDATGCGDTYVMAYIYRRSQGDSPRKAALFASSAATIKLEGKGPLTVGEVEVYNRLNNL